MHRAYTQFQRCWINHQLKAGTERGVTGSHRLSNQTVLFGISQNFHQRVYDKIHDPGTTGTNIGSYQFLKIPYKLQDCIGNENGKAYCLGPIVLDLESRTSSSAHCGNT